jgi:hypothetical protein
VESIPSTRSRAPPGVRAPPTKDLLVLRRPGKNSPRINTMSATIPLRPTTIRREAPMDDLLIAIA